MQHAPISQARYMQENRKMRFQEAYDGWSQGRLTQAQAALLLAVDLGDRAGTHTLRFLKSRQPDTPNPPSVVTRFLSNSQTTDHKNFLRQSAF